MKIRILLSIVLLALSTMVRGQGLYQKSIDKALAGDAGAQVDVGYAYETGDGVAKDMNQAIYWYRKGAENGNMYGQANLGWCYENGKGVERNPAQAFYWYKKSADQGLARGENGLGLCYENGTGVAKDMNQAVYWYRKAAEHGYMHAQANLGWCYENGKGVERNPAQAFYWYKKSADQGLARGENGLGLCYENGTGVAKDMNQAVYWYRKAADHGYMYAQANLGWCYYKGAGVAQDNKQAFYWNKKAADQGLARAQTWLGVFYEKGIGVEQNYTEMIYWYRKAADQKDGNASRNLGICYDYERGVSKDTEKALYYYREALAQGGLSQTDAEWTRNRINTLTSSNYTAKSKVPQRPVVTQQPIQQPVQQPKTVAHKVAGVDVNIPTTTQMDRNTFAVIIGNEKYDDEADVPYAENDAKIFKAYVQKTLGVPEKQIRYASNAGLNKMRSLVKWLTQAMEVSYGEAKVIFYYAGHGIPNESNQSAYLLPVDGMGSDPESAYSLDRLYSELSKQPAQYVAVFLDACFSGAKREGGMLASARGVAIKAKAQTPQGKMVVFTAAQGDETAYPYKEMGHGMFTYYLLKKLQDTKGDVTFGDLGDYLTSEVRRESFGENNKIQTPTVIPSQNLLNSWQTMKLR